MAKRDLVSVIVPFYNANPSFLEQAIDSVLGQSYSCWEMLLVDDGSSNASTAVAREYARRYDGQIHYLEHENHQNRGISSSRQLGIERARGSIVAFLDADDIWLENKLSDEVRLLNSQPNAGMLYGNSLYWYDWIGNLDHQKLNFLPDLGRFTDTLVQPPNLLPIYLLGEAAVPAPASIIVRRQVALQVGGFEADFPGMYEDQVFYAKVCLAVPVFVANTCWSYYRQHPESMCYSMDRNEQIAARLKYLNWLESYLGTANITDASVRLALRQAFWLIEGGPSWIPTSIRSSFRGRQVRKWILRLTRHLLPMGIRQRIWRVTQTPYDSTDT
jgi:glycosyltransferase involved in cell wall biosynthesis